MHARPSFRHTIAMFVALTITSAALFGAEPTFIWQPSTKSPLRIRLVQEDDTEPAETVEIPSVPPPPTEIVEDHAPIVAKPLINGPAITLEGPGAKIDGEETEDDEEHPDPGAVIFTYIPGSGDDFGMFGFEFRGMPQPHMPEASMMTAQPGWGITWLNGPENDDLPPQLYHIGLTIGGQAEINDDLVVDLAITPAWFTDWENRRRKHSG